MDLDPGTAELVEHDGPVTAEHFELHPVQYRSRYGGGAVTRGPGRSDPRLPLTRPHATQWADLSIDDYARRTAETKAGWQAMNGNQSGDPAKLAKALIEVIELGEPPLRFVAGNDAIPAVADKGRQITAQADASRELGFGLDIDD